MRRNGGADHDHDTEPDTGPSLLVPPKLAEPEETFVLVPVIGEPGVYMAVFSDGSYTRWIPKGASGED